MKVNENLRNAIFEVIDNQVNANEPAETALTLKRLMNEDHSEFEAKQPHKTLNRTREKTAHRLARMFVTRPSRREYD